MRGLPMGRNRQYDSVRLWRKWRVGREGHGVAEQWYTIGEAVSLLDIDRVTLADWLAKENMVALPDPRDKRSKLLKREQLVELARVHNRAIRDETSIGPRLTGVQRDLVARLQHVEEEVAMLKHALRLSEPRENGPTPLHVAEYPASSESHYSASYTPSGTGAYHGIRLRPGEWRTLPPIPPGWMPPRKLAEELGVPVRSFMHALRPRYEGDRERYGHLAYHAGRWQAPHRGTFATELLDEEQQEAARAWFATRGQ